MSESSPSRSKSMYSMAAQTAGHASVPMDKSGGGEVAIDLKDEFRFKSFHFEVPMDKSGDRR